MEALNELASAEVDRRQKVYKELKKSKKRIDPILDVPHKYTVKVYTRELMRASYPESFLANIRLSSQGARSDKPVMDQAVQQQIFGLYIL